MPLTSKKISNNLGVAAYVSLCSLLEHECFTSSLEKNVAFIGGISPNGRIFNTIQSKADMTACMLAFKRRGIHKVYCPLGTHCLMEDDFGIELV